MHVATHAKWVATGSKRGSSPARGAAGFRIGADFKAAARLAALLARSLQSERTLACQVEGQAFSSVCFCRTKS